MMQAFQKKFSGETFTEVPSTANDALFHRCTFHKLNGAVLKDCKLYGSRLVMTRPEDIIGITITLNCNTFNNVELSPEVFDYMLLLLCRTSGNTKKRLDIIEHIVGHDRSAMLLRETERLEG